MTKVPGTLGEALSTPDELERLGALTAYIQHGEERLETARTQRLALVRTLRDRAQPVQWSVIRDLTLISETYWRRATKWAPDSGHATAR